MDDAKRIQKTKLRSMCRQYDEVGVRALGNYASNPDIDPMVRIAAIKVLLERGHGRPKGEKIHKHTGADGEGPVVIELVQFAKSEK